MVKYYISFLGLRAKTNWDMMSPHVAPCYVYKIPLSKYVWQVIDKSN